MDNSLYLMERRIADVSLSVDGTVEIFLRSVKYFTVGNPGSYTRFLKAIQPQNITESIIASRMGVQG